MVVYREARKLWLAITVAYVALLPSFYVIFKAENRFTLMWDHSYHAAILTAVLSLGAVYYLAYVLVCKVLSVRGVLRRVSDTVVVWAAVVILVRTVVSLLDRSNVLHESIQSFLDKKIIKLMYYGFLPFVPILLWTKQAKRLVCGIYTLVSPMLIFLLVCPLTYITYDKNNPPLPHALVRAESIACGFATGNIYIFILDEWSYDRTFADNEMLQKLGHLNHLLEVSTFYQEAYSPGATTLTSIPRFLFQNDTAFLQLDYDGVKNFINSGKPHKGPSIFSNVPLGWFTAVVGFWHDYPKLLGHEVDYAARVHNEAARRTYWKEVMYLLRTQCAWLHWFHINVRLEDDHPSALWIYSQQEIPRQAKWIIRKVKAPTFAFFHYCMPHYPYVWDENGLKQEAVENYTYVESLEGYQNNLLYMDKTIADIVFTLKAAQKFDSSLLIITSDHSWRHDPDRPGYNAKHEDSNPFSPLKHVPLIVKQPGQRHGEVVNEVIHLDELYPLIQQVLNAKQEKPSRPSEAVKPY